MGNPVSPPDCRSHTWESVDVHAGDPCLVPVLFPSRRGQCLRIIAIQHQLGAYQRQQGRRRLLLGPEQRHEPRFRCTWNERKQAKWNSFQGDVA